MDQNYQVLAVLGLADPYHTYYLVAVLRIRLVVAHKHWEVQNIDLVDDSLLFRCS